MRVLPISMNTAVPNLPWEERPANGPDVLWRTSANPIIPRNLIPSSNSIFNSAVVPFKGAFAGVFRCDNKKREVNLNRCFSKNGMDWALDDQPITGERAGMDRSVKSVIGWRMRSCSK